MNIQTISWVFAVVFLAMGILGFVPGITTADGMLFGMFQTSAMNNIVYIVTGLAALWAALSNPENSRGLFKVLGVFYALVAVIGLIQGPTVLGILTANAALHFFHVIVALVGLWAGFGTSRTYPEADLATDVRRR